MQKFFFLFVFFFDGEKIDNTMIPCIFAVQYLHTFLCNVTRGYLRYMGPYTDYFFCFVRRAYLKYLKKKKKSDWEAEISGHSAS